MELTKRAVRTALGFTKDIQLAAWFGVGKAAVSNWPEDEPSDVAGDAWAGVIPMTTTFGAPSVAPDLRAGIPVPESVRNLR